MFEHSHARSSTNGRNGASFHWKRTTQISSSASFASLISRVGTMLYSPLARVAPVASRDARVGRVNPRSNPVFCRGAPGSTTTGRPRSRRLPIKRAVKPSAVLADATKGTSSYDDLDFSETEKYTWRVGGPNDIPCVHLRDVYKGVKPLEPRPSPFCTKSSCPVTIGARTPVSLNRTFVSEDDRVLLKSMAFGYVCCFAWLVWCVRGRNKPEFRQSGRHATPRSLPIPRRTKKYSHSALNSPQKNATDLPIRSAPPVPSNATRAASSG